MKNGKRKDRKDNIMLHVENPESILVFLGVLAIATFFFVVYLIVCFYDMFKFDLDLKKKIKENK